MGINSYELKYLLFDALFINFEVQYIDSILALALIASSTNLKPSRIT